MGTTLWFIGIDEKGNLHRLPSTVFEGKETKLKNQTIKAVELVIYLENRKPTEIKRAYYYKLKFKEDGILDKDHYDEGTQLQISSINLIGDNLTNEELLSRQKYESKYSWTPSKKDIKLINQYLNKKGLPLCKLLSYR